jgi:hypothetical protein
MKPLWMAACCGWTFQVGQASIGDMDVKIPELGFPLLVGRVYDSRNRHDGSFGPGWSLPHEAANVQAEYTYSPSEGWGEEARGSFLKTYYVISRTRKVLVLRLGDGVGVHIPHGSQPEIESPLPRSWTPRSR